MPGMNSAGKVVNGYKRISAHEALEFIGRLYAIEREAKEQQLDAAGIQKLRQEQARPILREFKAWLEARLRELAPKPNSCSSKTVTLTPLLANSRAVCRPV